jgi:beta-glucosidase
LQGQVEYVQQLAAYGKPVILVIVSGRPRLLHDAVTSSAAVLNAYVPGTHSTLWLFAAGCACAGY